MRVNRNRRELIAIGVLAFFMLMMPRNIYCQQDSTKGKYNKSDLTVGALGFARGIFSINYEMMFKPGRIKPLIFTADVGLGYTWGSNESKQKGIVYFPVGAGFLLGGGNHYGHVRVGYTGAIGQEIIDTTYSRKPPSVKNESAYIVSVAYRYMKYNDLVAEISPMTLVWTNNPNKRYTWSFGFSIGAGF